MIQTISIRACFAHNEGYCDSEDLAKRTVWDKVLKDIAYEVAIKPRYDAYQRRLESVMYKLFDKKMELRATWKLKPNINEMLANKASKERKCMQALKQMFGQQI